MLGKVGLEEDRVNLELTAPAVFRVLLIEDNRVDALLVTEAAAKADDCQIGMDHAQSLGEALRRLGEARYDVILTDLMLPDSLGLDTVIRVHEAAPEVPIVVLSSLDDETLAIRAVQSGAQDYIVKGQFTPKQVLRTIRHAVVRFGTSARRVAPAAAGSLGQVVAFAGVKGGVGTTVIACQLALELQAHTGKRVALLDLDLRSGMTSFVLKVEPRYSVLDAAMSVGRLDLSLWKNLVQSGSHKVDVLPAPDQPVSDKLRPQLASLRAVLSFVRTNYEWIVLDLGSWPPPEEYLPLLGEASHCFLVTLPDLMALYRTKRVIRSLSEGGPPTAGQVGLVLNRMPKRFDMELREIESLLGMPVYAVLPDAPDEVAESLAKGRSFTSGGGIGKSVAAFTRRLTGAAEPATTEKRAGIFGVSRFGRATA